MERSQVQLLPFALGFLSFSLWLCSTLAVMTAFACSFILFFFSCIFAFVAFAATPSVRIIEFLYDAEGSDVGKEYVLFVNDGTTSLSLLSLVFVEHGRRHALREGVGGTLLSPGERAVIASNPSLFLEQYSFSGPVLDSGNFSLNNTASVLELFFENALLDKISYTNTAAAGLAVHVSSDGSFSFLPSSFFEQSVVIGAALHLVTAPSVIFSASVVSFSALRGGEPAYGLWNFGDGVQMFGSTVEHAYLYPGEYVLSFQEQDVREGASFLREEISVIFPQVTARRLDSSSVQVTNHHPFTLDISGWSLTSDSLLYTFPSSTQLAPQEKMLVSLAVFAGSPIFIITAGGGQFDGKSFMPDPEVPLQDPSELISQRVAPSEPPPFLPDTEQSASVVVEKEEERVGGFSTFFIWFALLFAIVALALAPLFIVRAEKEKRLRDDV